MNSFLNFYDNYLFSVFINFFIISVLMLLIMPSYIRIIAVSNLIHSIFYIVLFLSLKKKQLLIGSSFIFFRFNFIVIIGGMFWSKYTLLSYWFWDLIEIKSIIVFISILVIFHNRFKLTSLLWSSLLLIVNNFYIMSTKSNHRFNISNYLIESATTTVTHDLSLINSIILKLLFLIFSYFFFQCGSNGKTLLNLKLILKPTWHKLIY